MGSKHKLKQITNGVTKIYARQGGWHYHLDRECIMLGGSDFEKFGYKEISKSDIVRRRLNPCACAYVDFGIRKTSLGGKG